MNSFLHPGEEGELRTYIRREQGERRKENERERRFD